jgi:hypothetical protein
MYDGHEGRHGRVLDLVGDDVAYDFLDFAGDSFPAYVIAQLFQLQYL